MENKFQLLKEQRKVLKSGKKLFRKGIYLSELSFSPMLFFFNKITMNRFQKKEEQEDARRRLRGMCGFKKELRVCWMEMEVE